MTAEVDARFEAYDNPMKPAMLRAKKHVSLLFHTGASIPGDHRRLTGGGDAARYMTFEDLTDVEATAHDIRAVTWAWCDARA